MAAPSVADPLGHDAYIGLVDLDPTGRSATGLELYEAAIWHRITCEQLLMIGSGIVDPVTGLEVIPFGVDVRTWCGEVLDRADMGNKATILDEVIHRDPRTAKTAITVSSAPAGTVMPSGALAVLLIHIVATAVTGEILDRIVGVNSISVEFLAAGR